MKISVQVVIALLLACNLGACGTKGKLKTPTEIQKDDARKAKQAAKKQKEQDNNANMLPDDAIPLPASAPSAAELPAPVNEQ